MPTITELMTANLSRVFANANRYERHLAVVELYTPDIRFTDPEGEVHGQAAVEARVEELFSQTPAGFGVLSSGPAYVRGDTGALPWSLGPVGGAPAVRGLDIVTVQGGKIATIETLISQ